MSNLNRNDPRQAFITTNRPQASALDPAAADVSPIDPRTITAPDDSISWRKILGVGVVVYIVGLFVYGLTENLNLIPGLIFLGAFLVPVAYVAYFYQHRHRSSVTLPTVAAAFFYGGFIGVFAAAILEEVYTFGLAGLPLDGLALALAVFFGVGLIEEFAKLLGVVVVARRAQHAAEIDGIIIGAAAGMGFAALESSGYVLNAFIASRGSLTAALLITAFRGLLAPLGHGTWTAIIASVLFREARGGRFQVNGAVIGAFLSAAILHALWDASGPIVSTLPINPSDGAWIYLVVLLIIGAIGLAVLRNRWREAMQIQNETELPPRSERRPALAE